MSEPTVDVLTGIDRLIGNTRAAGVAELIEAARDDADARDSETTDERLEEIADKVCDYAPTLEQIRKETAKRLRAALARVGGTK